VPLGQEVGVVVVVGCGLHLHVLKSHP
jgi:hypothetical protein